MARILIVDDEAGVCRAFEQFLSEHETSAVGTVSAGLEAVASFKPDLVFLDIRLPDRDGLEALPEFLDVCPDVVVMTAHGTLDTAVKAVRSGARDYLPKPIDLDRVESVVSRVVGEDEDAEQVRSLLREFDEGTHGGFLVGSTPSMQQVFTQIAAVCETDASVLVEGESGTGKELVARAIHQHSPRTEKPFEPINCAAIPDALLESELFGHEKGAFTGAHAQRIGKLESTDGGTVFLDEVGDMPSQAQVKLLRFLEERSFSRVGGNQKIDVNVRIIGATHQVLADLVEQGTFREDLYFRLNVVRIELPPLRARRDDIPLLTAHFLARNDSEGITQAALDRLMRHDWPGNVRELRNVLERAAVMARKGMIGEEHFPSFGSASTESGTVEALVRSRIALMSPGAVHQGVEAEWERELLRQVLEKFEGNQVQSSDFLGIHRTTLRRKMEEYGL